MNQNRKKMRKSKNILLLIIFLLCGVVSYGQFSLGGNGVTIECPGVALGESGVVGGKTYWAVNKSKINQFLNRLRDTGTGSFEAAFPTAGTTHTHRQILVAFVLLTQLILIPFLKKEIHLIKTSAAGTPQMLLI